MLYRGKEREECVCWACARAKREARSVRASQRVRVAAARQRRAAARLLLRTSAPPAVKEPLGREWQSSKLSHSCQGCGSKDRSGPRTCSEIASQPGFGACLRTFCLAVYMRPCAQQEKRALLQRSPKLHVLKEQSVCGCYHRPFVFRALLLLLVAGGPECLPWGEAKSRTCACIV